VSPDGNSIALRLRRVGRARVVSGSARRLVADAFHRIFYYSAMVGGTWHTVEWLGTPAWKCPLDLWIYQEIVHERRPDVILETGTWRGGTSYFLATLCELIGRGQVVTVDIEKQSDRPTHERIEYLHGSSVDPEIIESIRGRVKGRRRVMVILDSDHSEKHVREELRLYSDLVTEGDYLIVEDTNVNGHPVLPEHGPGPMEAVERFLSADGRFERDESRERLLLTFNPRGYLRRTSA
jgi:cephalosporin hydroxylase